MHFYSLWKIQRGPFQELDVTEKSKLGTMKNEMKNDRLEQTIIQMKKKSL
jgi:hypothetical protein